MKKITTDETIKQIGQELLAEDAQILFLPAVCQKLNDSYGERYLHCMVPESAICLMNGSKAVIAIGDGCYWLPLMLTNGSSLQFTSEARIAVPSKIELVLREQFEQLAGSPNQNCGIELVDWLYEKQPKSMQPILEHFLSKPDRWLVGLPPKAELRRLFSEPPVDVPENDEVIWYELRSLRICKPCLND